MVNLKKRIIINFIILFLQTKIITKMCKKVSKKVDKKEKNQIDFDLKVNNLFF